MATARTPWGTFCRADYSVCFTSLDDMVKSGWTPPAQDGWRSA
ncbi:hypothetical protein [Streptomyces fagopyri]|nr:hypothetical protein [Streptomyces fagopyri]